MKRIRNWWWDRGEDPPEPPEPGWCCHWCGKLYDGPRCAWLRYRWWYFKALLIRSFHRDAA